MEAPFSVLMSLYIRESARNVGECLTSIQAQDRKADQIVIVEDGPIQPEVEAVLVQWGQRVPIERVKLNENIGLGRALNAGLAICRNELVARMDTDDVLVPGRFKKQIARLESCADLCVIGGQIEEFDEGRAETQMRLVPLRHAEILRRALFRNPVNHMTAAFRKSAVLGLGAYRDVPGYEDYDLWLRCLHAGLIFENLPDVLVRARTGPTFVARRSGRNHLSGEIEICKTKLRTGIWPWPLVIIVTFARILARVSPKTVVQLVYSTVLRGR